MFLFSTAALEQQPHFDLRPLHLLEVEKAGVPRPRLLPLFLPVTESDGIGRSLPRCVASAMASRICFCITI